VGCSNYCIFVLSLRRELFIVHERYDTHFDTHCNFIVCNVFMPRANDDFSFQFLFKFYYLSVPDLRKFDFHMW